MRHKLRLTDRWVHSRIQIPETIEKATWKRTDRLIGELHVTVGVDDVQLAQTAMPGPLVYQLFVYAADFNAVVAHL